MEDNYDKMNNNINTKTQVSSSEQRCVGLVYDERMCKHYHPSDENHEECPGRILSIWNKLMSTGLTKRCSVFGAKEVDDKSISAVHKSKHIDLIKTISSDNEKRKMMAREENKLSVYVNEGSTESAYLAAGSVVEAAEKVAKGELNSAFAIVRPPGHHAERCKPMGFCLFNNVAIATSFLLNQKELGINKILIVDWDVHHGNGTQKMFYNDPRVLFFSVHRHNNFYPGGDNGSHIMTGAGLGAGYNINVPWQSGGYGDADYMTVWDQILIPVAREFNPDIVMISAGFDAALGDLLGQCCVTPTGYAVMLQKLMEFSDGKIVMALEGGYNLDSTANSVHACVEVLLDGKPIDESVKVDPLESTWEVIKTVREELSKFWLILSEKPSQTSTEVDLTKPLSQLKLGEEDAYASKLASSFSREFVGVISSSAQAPSMEVAPSKESAAAYDDDDDDFDLFGDETEEEKKAADERDQAKASTKTKESGKMSLVVMDIKPWDDETDMKKLEEAVRSVDLPGLLWGPSKLVPVAYGIKKLTITLTIDQDLVSVDSLIDEWLTDEPINEYVQCCDIVDSF